MIEVSTFRSNPIDALVDEAAAELKQDLLIRHDNVFGNEEEDARRARDFTINGLFYDLDEGKVVDHVGGMADLSGALGCGPSGNPSTCRMREDPVRILRAIRFAAKCELSFEPETLAAMKAHAQEIPRCAPPRVLEELLKLTRCGHARRCVELMREVGVLKILLPPIDAVFAARSREASRDSSCARSMRSTCTCATTRFPFDAVAAARRCFAPLPAQRRAGPSRSPRVAPVVLLRLATRLRMARPLEGAPADPDAAAARRGKRTPGRDRSRARGLESPAR